MTKEKSNTLQMPKMGGPKRSSSKGPGSRGSSKGSANSKGAKVSPKASPNLGPKAPKNKEKK